MNAKMLDGKVAIVSGASYGMGYSMAELFAKEDIDGGLVGGASLKPSFGEIVNYK